MTTAVVALMSYYYDLLSRYDYDFGVKIHHFEVAAAVSNVSLLFWCCHDAAHTAGGNGRHGWLLEGLIAAGMVVTSA